MLKDRNQTQKNTVSTLQLKTTRNIAVVEHVEFITPLSKGTHTHHGNMGYLRKRASERTLMILVR